MKSYDTIIVGAGLAGLQCASALANRGMSVLLVDRKRSLKQAIHTTGIFVRKTLEDFDIPDYCLGPAVRRVTLYSPSLRAMEIVSEHDEFRIGRMGMLYEHYLNQALRAGVEWLPQTSYLAHSREAGRLVVRLERQSEDRSVPVRYIIAADGAHSRVATNLGLDSNREWIVGIEKVFVGARLNGPPRLLCFLDPALAPGYIGWIAHDGEETHVGVAGYRASFNPLESLNKLRTKTNHIVDLSGAEEVEQRGGTIPIGGVLRRIANHNGLSIGDAAGAVSPLTAGGLDPCMRLSALAANVIAEYLRTDDVRVLNTYSGNFFRTRFTSRLWARRLASTFRNPTAIELALAALSTPLLKRLATHIFFGRCSFPDVDVRFELPNSSSIDVVG
ncbi:MAG TPA: NAD(P)/FAD-dependent oxidoreductase [Pyrinomonadaceae bacterium]|nr:NAD(P)/FAD-dependent oxidoreductase [Pyrinomonadaceae bacterium]